MIYIDFYCAKSKLEEWKVWCKENDIDDDEPERRLHSWAMATNLSRPDFQRLSESPYKGSPGLPGWLGGRLIQDFSGATSDSLNPGRVRPQG